VGHWLKKPKYFAEHWLKKTKKYPPAGHWLKGPNIPPCRALGQKIPKFPPCGALAKECPNCFLAQYWLTFAFKTIPLKLKNNVFHMEKFLKNTL
jgi:hypothetical protein